MNKSQLQKVLNKAPSGFVAVFEINKVPNYLAFDLVVGEEVIKAEHESEYPDEEGYMFRQPNVSQFEFGIKLHCVSFVEYRKVLW